MLVLTLRNLGAHETRERRVFVGESMILTLEGTSCDGCAVSVATAAGVRVLRLREQDSRDLAPGISLTLCEINSNKVRLGIDAPKSVRVMREKVMTANEIEAVERVVGLVA